MLFQLTKVRQSDQHNIYRISDEKELSKVIIDEGEKHRIANIVRERNVQGRRQYLVRWVRYPSSFDSWEFADELE